MESLYNTHNIHTIQEKGIRREKREEPWRERRMKKGVQHNTKEKNHTTPGLIALTFRANACI
jgi:hypothetical protein